MNVADLLAKADNASPRVNTLSNDWKTLYPVVEKLQAKGFSMLTSIQWLIEQKAVSEKNKQKAYNAFYKIKQRRAKRQ